MTLRVDAICAGKVVPFNGAERSAIVKEAVKGPVRIHRFGIEGDEQADLRVHGGPEMAVHHYPLDHHDFWQGELDDPSLLNDPGAFGSNLSVRGLVENDVQIGDRFQLGTATLEVCQPRQPCWKIDHRFARSGMVAAIIRTGRCGWYYRVVQDGTAQAGDMLKLLDGVRSGWSVRAVFDALISRPKHAATAQLEQLAVLEGLAPKLRARAADRLTAG